MADVDSIFYSSLNLLVYISHFPPPARPPEILSFLRRFFFDFSLTRKHSTSYCFLCFPAKAHGSEATESKFKCRVDAHVGDTPCTLSRLMVASGTSPCSLQARFPVWSHWFSSTSASFLLRPVNALLPSQPLCVPFSPFTLSAWPKVPR